MTQIHSDFQANLYNRFAALAQELLCEGNASREVAECAIEKIKDDAMPYSVSQLNSDFIRETQYILDQEIDHYFYGMLEKIRHGDKQCRERLCRILSARFKKLVLRRVKLDSDCMSVEDAEDVAQKALIIVLEKMTDAEPKGLFIQWAQMILNNKYREQRRRNRKMMNRTESMDNTLYERPVTTRLPEVMTQSTGKQISSEYPIPEEVTGDPFEGDPHVLTPDQIVEGIDLKHQLLAILPKITREACHKVFRVLFSQGDRKFIFRNFPDKTPQQIDLLISQCRRQLKEAAIVQGIL